MPILHKVLVLQFLSSLQVQPVVGKNRVWTQLNINLKIIQIKMSSSLHRREISFQEMFVTMREWGGIAFKKKKWLMDLFEFIWVYNISKTSVCIVVSH